jgi:hypothetical protein
MSDEDLDTSGAVAAFMGGALPDRARASVAAAVNSEPDFEARVRKMANAAGVPVSTARAMPEDVKRKATLNTMDFDDLAQRMPATMSFLAEQDNAKISHDDVDNMGLIESTINSFKRGWPGLKQNASATALRANANVLANIDAVEAKISAGENVLDSEDPYALRFMTPERRATFRAQALGGAGQQAASIASNEAAKAAIPSAPVVGQVMRSETFGEAIGAFMTDPVTFVASIGPESLVQSAPGLVAAAVIPGGAGAKAMTMGAGSFATDYGASIVEGLRRAGVDVKDPKALQAAAADPKLMQRVAAQAMAHAMVVGGVDAVSGGVAAKSLAGSTALASRPVAREMANLGIQVPVQGTFGALGEAGGQVAAGQELEPGNILAEFVGESFTAPAEVAGIAAGQIRERVGQARQANADAAALEQLSKLSEASKVRGRDAQTFQTFVAQLAEEGGDAPTELYVDGTQLANSLAQSGITMAELEAIAPVVAKQMAEAQTGADVRVPVSEFVAAGESFSAPLIDHVRTSPEAMSRAEAEEFLKGQGDQLKADVEKALEQQDDQAEQRTAIEGVRQVFEQQILETKRFKAPVAKAYAELLANFFGAQAARVGVSPQQLLQKYQLDVVAQGTGSGKRRVLSQAPAADDRPAGVLLEAGKDKGLFQYPQGKASDLVELAAEKNPAIKVKAESITQMDGSEKSTGNWDIVLPSGDVAIMTRQGNEVWINAAGLEAGSGGSLVYDLAANYALNNGLVFIGDPAGLSDAAMVRRAENMLSSAVKYGTTDHIAPHPKQVAGSDTVPPLNWTPGDTLGNIEALMAVTTAANAKLAPAGQGVEYDAASDQFTDSVGSPLEGSAGIALLAEVDRGTAGAGAPGETTLRRDALFRALLQGPDQRRAVLARLHQQQAGGGSQAGGALDRSFYQDKQPGVAADRAAISFADDITAAPSVIALLEGADLTSFVHESGHFFLEVQSDLALRIQQQIDGGASVRDGERAIVDDMNALLDWFGVKGSENQTALQEWASMSLDEKRESHEKFARGFEAYAMEGNAPSQELQGVFQRFRSWLVQVYKTLRALNVELTDDVRQVMNRMLATDVAIETAEAQRNMGPLFADPKSAGLTPQEYIDYQALASTATATAAEDLQARSLKDLKWASNAKAKALKARQDEVEGLRSDVRAEISAETMAEPIYQAWQFLTSKSEDAAEAGKLRTEELRDMYGESETAIWRKLSALRMTSDATGISPESVADRFGFDSADSLVKQLVAAMPPAEVIEARTDQRMLEMFGDITSEAALNRAADEAVHNEARARFIATELRALDQAMTVREDAGKNKKGHRQTVDVLARAAKQYAEFAIARLKVRDIRPSLYASAEARSARLAMQTLAKGKLDEAALHKRNQLVNNYATKAAYNAQDEVQSAAKYFRKFDKRRDSIADDYQDQIEQLLERFDFRPATLKAIDKRKDFAEWYAEQLAAGTEPSVPPELLAAAGKTSYKDMTLEELRGLRETIEQMEHMGRLKNRLLLARDQRNYEAIANEIADSIVEHGGPERKVQLEGPNPTMDWLAGAAAAHRKLASLIRQMDGGNDNGPMWQHIGRAMNERGTMEDVMVEQATVALSEIYAPVMALKGGTAGAKVYIPEINASLSRGGRLAVALNWGNEANRQRVRDGDQWSDGQVRAILRTLSSTELEFVNNIWRYLDTYWDQIADKEKRLTGVAPEKVEAVPFTAIAADGTEVPMRGGYYPLKYDTDRSDRAETQEAAQVAKEMMQGAVTKATTRRGHTKERLKEVKRAVRKDLNVITQHVTQVVHDLSWHEWLMDTNRLLADDKIVDAIRSHYGPAVLKTMRDDLLGIATSDFTPGTKIDEKLLWLRGNVTRATMGASLTTAFLQPFGLTQSIVRIGGKHVLRGVARWGGDAIRLENSLQWIHGKSDFMRLRAKTFNRELREIRGQVNGKSKTMRVVDAGLFMLMQKMQMVADVPTWIGQYEKSIAQGSDESSAVAMADRAVLEAQGGGSPKDMAEVQRKHPMLTQFYSYFSVTLNLAIESTAKTNFKNPAAVAGWASDMALLMVIPAILPPLIMYALRGGDDDDERGWMKRLAQWQAGYLLGTVVGAREFSGMVSGFDYAGPPVARIVGDVTKLSKQAAQWELDEGAVLAMLNVVGDLTGTPAVQIARSYKGWKAWDEGVDGAGPQSVLLGPPPRD